METGCDSLATLIMNCRSPVVEEKLLHELILLTECNRTSHSLSSMNMGVLLLLKLNYWAHRNCP